MNELKAFNRLPWLTLRMILQEAKLRQDTQKMILDLVNISFPGAMRFKFALISKKELIDMMEALVCTREEVSAVDSVTPNDCHVDISVGLE